MLNENYIDLIYRFCYKRLGNTSDAEDLAQDIIFEIIKALKKGVQPRFYNSWMWSVARNRWRKYIERQKRLRERTVSLEGGQYMASICLTVDDYVDNSMLRDEELNEVNLAISRLSVLYREILVLYYIKAQSVKEISKTLSLAEGTVKRRLHDARNIVRKGIESVADNGIRSYSPVCLDIWGGYSLPNYWKDLSKNLTRNILAASYDKPVSLEDLSKELGVACVFLEEEVDRLIHDKFIKQYGNSRYLTDFIIFDAKLKAEFDVAVADAWEGLGRKLIDSMESVKSSIRAMEFYGNDFEWDYLLWIFIVFACTSFSEMALEQYKKNRVNWDLQLYGKDYRIAGMVRQADGNIGPDYADVKWVSWSNLHSYIEGVSGFRGVQYANLYQYEPFGDRDDLVNPSNAGLLLKLAEDPVAHLSEYEEEHAARLVERGILISRKDRLLPQIPIIRANVLSKIQRLISSAIEPCVGDTADKVGKLADKMLLPSVRKDLLEQYVNWVVAGCFSPLQYVHYQCRTDRLLKYPTDFNRAPHALYLRVDE